MNGLIAWWARNRVAANLMMVGIFISGALGFMNLGREIQPTIPVNWVQIQAVWPGASPTEIEEQILIRIEESVADMEEIDRIRGFAAESTGQIYLEGNPKLDIDDFLNDVKSRVDGIGSLPRDMEPLKVSKIYTRNELIRVAVHGNVSEKTLTDTAQMIRNEVATLPGASVVEMFGKRREEVNIEISESTMQRYGLTFDQVASAIRGSSVNISSGNVQTDTGDVSIRARNQATNEADFGEIIVRQTEDGAIIRLRDIASIDDGFEEEEILATLNGEPAILVNIMSTQEMNVVRTSEEVTKWVSENQNLMPEGVSMTIWTDRSKIYKDRMATISGAAISGLALVFLVLILTLRPIVAFWVTIGIATAFAGSFILLDSYGITLNMLSLFAFLLVIGVVVDDAIVVGESIHHESHNSGGGLTSAIVGTQLVAKPVLFAVLTTMVAFAPWLFLDGFMVQMTRHIAIPVVLALTFSLIEAFFILPAHLSKLKPRENLGTFGRFQKRIEDSVINFAQNTYRPFAEKFVRNRALVASIFIGFFILSAGLLSSNWVKFTFMPVIEDEEIVITVNMPEGTPYDRALQVLAHLQQAQQALTDEFNSQYAEEDNRQLIEKWYTRSRRDSVLAIVKLAPPEMRDISTKEAALRLRDLIGDIPDAKEVTVDYMIDNGGDNRGISYSIKSKDPEMLQAATDALKEKLRTYASAYDVRDNLNSATDEIHLTLKPGAEQLGIDLARVTRQVRQAYYGEEVQRLARPNGDVRVMLRYPRDTRRSLESLSNFRVRLNDGREVPLLQVVDIEFTPGINRIQRWERHRAAIVNADLRNDDFETIRKDLNDNFFPQWEKDFPGAKRGAIGQAEGEAQFFAEVGTLYMIALFTMYALIAVAFRSYFLPLLVMTAIPFAFMGAVYGHFFMGASLTLFSYFGIGAAVGVVINDNLVLVDYILRLRAKGMNAYDAIVEAGVARFRPILLTSITTFVGLIPMMLERSTQAAFLKPTVIALAFGVLIATFVTLILVPALYCIAEDIRVFFIRLWKRVSGQQVPTKEELTGQALQPGE